MKGNGGQTYDGMWLNDEQHGQGKETWQDGSEYIGEYMMGKKHGSGKYKWQDGSCYNGVWDNGDI